MPTDKNLGQVAETQFSTNKLTNALQTPEDRNLVSKNMNIISSTNKDDLYGEIKFDTSKYTTTEGAFDQAVYEGPPEMDKLKNFVAANGKTTSVQQNKIN